MRKSVIACVLMLAAAALAGPVGAQQVPEASKSAEPPATTGAAPAPGASSGSGGSPATSSGSGAAPGAMTAPAPTTPTPTPTPPAAGSGTGASGTAATTVVPPAAPVPTPVAFQDAIVVAVKGLFAKAQLPPGTDPLMLVIDPLIDGQSGTQSSATRFVEKKLIEYIRREQPRFDVQPFTSESVTKLPVVLIGTLTAVNMEKKADGPKDAFRVCLALADLRTGTVIAKGVGFADPQGIDPSPTQFFDDSPVWTRDQAINGYVKTCQASKLGGPIEKDYLDRIAAAALLSDAIAAYDNRRYKRALELYQLALQAPGGDQLRALNGIYLANWRLSRPKEMRAAFAKVVDHGLSGEQLAVLFLFRPGSVLFYSPGKKELPYPMWVDVLAERIAERKACIELVGHTTKTGSAGLNLRLSALRAQYVKGRLETERPEVGGLIISNGVGSAENIVGTAKDNASDVLDRRVEMKVLKCS